MRINEQNIQTLPDIEMYGGDTAPWQFYLAHDNGTYYDIGTVSGYSASLNIIAYYMSTGVNMTGTPVLTKTGTIKTVDGIAAAEFTLSDSDTISMAGKYIYQVEVTYGSEKRVAQGNLYIHANITQAVTE